MAACKRFYIDIAQNVEIDCNLKYDTLFNNIIGKAYA